MKNNTFVFQRVAFPLSRVVFRGYNNANANGGVSYASASSGASYSDSGIGSRLAFRGKLVRAESVEAYKAIREVL